MPIIASNVLWRPLKGKSVTGVEHRIINVHTMVGTIEGTESYFSHAGNPYSHFGVPAAGKAWQWQDLSYRAASDLNGNPFCISIETEDKGPEFPTWSGSDVPRWTDAQAETLAQLIAWLCVRFNIPPVLVPDSINGRHGPSYHRLGIDPWRVANGVLYSSSFAKACPGDRRIAQLKTEVMPRVVEIITGEVPEDDMPYARLVRVKDDGSLWGVSAEGRWYYPNQSQVDVDVSLKLVEDNKDVVAKSQIAWKTLRGPSFWPEDVAPGQLVEFVSDPSGVGWWLVFGTCWRWHIESETVLFDFQRHWSGRGYVTTVRTWSEGDLTAIPIAGSIGEGTPPGPIPDVGEMTIVFSGTGRATPAD